MKEVVGEIKSLKESLNAKYNVLLGMITFLGVVVAVIGFMKG